jgi:peptidoglycan hydrolase-like protein with peptidoglycan-binding domain
MADQDEPSNRNVDDWFADSELSSPRVQGGRALPDKHELPTLEQADNWLTTQEPVRRRRRGFAAAPYGPNPRLLAAGGLIALVLLVIGLVAGGVFSSSPTTTTSAASRPTTPSTTTRGKVAAISIPTSTLKPGDHGPSVKVLQQGLASLGYSPGGADGQYGAATKHALANFQQANKLAADGVLGPATLGALRRALRQRG